MHIDIGLFGIHFEKARTGTIECALPVGLGERHAGVTWYAGEISARRGSGREGHLCGHPRKGARGADAHGRGCQAGASR